MADLLERSQSRFHAAPFGIEWDGETVNKLDEGWFAKCREDFWAFRQQVHPELKMSWWQFGVADLMQDFYDDSSTGCGPSWCSAARRSRPRKSTSSAST